MSYSVEDRAASGPDELYHSFDQERAAKAWLEEKVFCATGPGGGIDPTCSLGGGGTRQNELVNKWVKSPDGLTDQEKSELAEFARTSKTNQKDLIRISRKDYKHEVGDTVDFEGPTSFSGAVKDVLAGEAIGHIGWKSSDKALYRIQSPKRGLDVDYSKLTGMQFSASGEKETITAGRYRVVKKGSVTEPGTRPEQGYRVKMYILEEV